MACLAVFWCVLFIVSFVLTGVHGGLSEPRKRALVTTTAELALRQAISSPTVTQFILTKSLYLTGSFPPVPPNKNFTLIGHCPGRAQCFIEGFNKWRGFVSTSKAGWPHLTIVNINFNHLAALPIDSANGACIDYAKGSIKIYNSGFYRNSPHAIKLSGDVVLYMNGSIFWKNKSPSHGAAILTGDDGPAITITKSRIEKSHANGETGVGGGAIFALGYLKITESTVKHNKMVRGSGAIYASIRRKGWAIFKDVDFSYNNALTGKAAGLFLSGFRAPRKAILCNVSWKYNYAGQVATRNRRVGNILVAPLRRAVPLLYVEPLPPHVPGVFPVGFKQVKAENLCNL